eukprot:gene3579-4666_t
MAHSVNSAITSAAGRSDDLCRTLTGIMSDPSKLRDYSSALSQFQQLSAQLGLLQEGDWGTAFERHAAVPSSAEDIHAALIPQLLSTRLDKEQEEHLARVAAEAQQDPQPVAPAEIELHNERLRGAARHLLDAALEHELPGALELERRTQSRGVARRAGGAPQPGTEASAAAASAGT